ncbi:C2-domain-containing protein, partial [Conidiobolus coronatus NRRL 28638]
MSKKSSTEYSQVSNDDNSSPFIRFRLISGRNLVSRDINGFSDPFVVIKVEGGRVQSGKQMKTLNPEWNEILDLVPDWSRFPTTIKMVCWDWDRFGRDFMGEVKVSMKSLFN